MTVSKLVEFPLESGGTMLVEVGDFVGSVPLTRGLRPSVNGENVAERAKQSFEGAVERIQPTAQVLVGRLRAMADAPHEVQVQFGMNLHAEAGAFVAAASTGANFTVTLTWRR